MTTQCLKHAHCHKQLLLHLDVMLIVFVKPRYECLIIYFLISILAQTDTSVSNKHIFG